jgi:2'-5' RNA ligase
MQNEARERLFLAIWPDESAQQHVREITLHLARQLGRQVDGKSNRHVTLKFLGDVAAEDKQALISMCAAIRAKSFELVLDTIRLRPRQQIVWLEASTQPPELGTLLSDLTIGLTQLGFVQEERPFIAHMTLFRHVRRVNRLLELKAPVRWRVTHFDLVRSILTPEGANHEILCKWELR